MKMRFMRGLRSKMDDDKLPRYRVSVEEEQIEGCIALLICYGVSNLATSKELFREV